MLELTMRFLSTFSFLMVLTWVGLSNGAFAAPRNVTCPPAEALQKATLEYTDTERFDPKTTTVIFVAVGDLSYKGKWIFGITKLRAGQGENLLTIANAAKERLVLHSATPFAFEEENGEEPQPICVYSLPDNDSISAIAFLERSKAMTFEARVHNMTSRLNKF